MSVVESIVSWCSSLFSPRVRGMRTLADGNRVVRDEITRTAD